MPRQLLLSSFTFLAPMDDWKTKDSNNNEQKTATNDSPQENNNNDDDFFGGGDFVEAAEDGNEHAYIRSHYVPLTCCKPLFYVLTPMVTMKPEFEAISEEDLGLFKLTPTLDFTLSLNLNFHGNEDRSSKQMFESLGKIRFLRSLQLFGRISDDDFKQIGQLHFLESLDLSQLGRFTDNSLKSLNGLVNLKYLDLSDWKRLTKRGIAEIPKVAPNLETLILHRNEKLENDCFNCFKDQGYGKSLRKIVLYTSNKFHAETTFSALFECCYNLEYYRETHTMLKAGDRIGRNLARFCPNLRHVDLCSFRKIFPIVKCLGRSCGDRLEFLRLSAYLTTAHADEVRIPKTLKYLARYFKSLEYVSICGFQCFKTFMMNKYFDGYPLSADKVLDHYKKSKGWTTIYSTSPTNPHGGLRADVPSLSPADDWICLKENIQSFLDIIRAGDHVAWKKMSRVGLDDPAAADNGGDNDDGVVLQGRFALPKYTEEETDDDNDIGESDEHDEYYWN